MKNLDNTKKIPKNSEITENNPIKILYCSSLCSYQMLDYIFRESKGKPLQSIQKFHRLFAEGVRSLGNEITVLSSIPVIRASNKKIWWPKKSEIHKEIKYIYLPFINLPLIRQLFIAFFAFIETLIWHLKNRYGHSVIICDVLNISISSGSLLSAKLSGIKTCGIVTDIPEMLGNVETQKRNSGFSKWIISINSFLLASFDSYIFLTEQMNDLVNIHKKPNMIMEGLVDIKMGEIHNSLTSKASERIIIYAGGLYEKYGIRKLIEAFKRLEGDDLRLYLYGDGDMRDDLPKFMNEDKRVVYFGVVPNQKIVEELSRATLLVNPRPSDQEYTKYSFPSKNMEYMVSGTPLVTTPLPGMPEEYYNYVYLFSNESVEGIYLTLKFILSKSREVLHTFGCTARKFVIENKNNLIQAERLLSFVNKLYQPPS